MKHYILIFCLFSINSLHAQQSTFSIVYYDSLFTFNGHGIISKKIIEALDDGYIIVGNYDEFDPKGFLIKIDTAGNIVWNKIYDLNPATSTIEFTNIIATHDSSYIIVGNLYDINTGRALCMKTDINGDILWSTTITHGTFNIYKIYDVIETTDYDFILTGHYDELLIAKIDSSGNLEWSNLYQSINSGSIGYSINQYNDIYIVGGLKYNISPTNPSGFLLYIDTSGTPFSSKIVDFSMAASPIGFNFLIKNNKLTLLIDNDFSTSLAEIDTSGNIYWHQVYSNDNIGCFDCNGNQLKTTLDGGFIFTTYAFFGLGGNVTKTDSIGLLLWKKQIENRTIDVLSIIDTTYLVLGNGPLYGFKSADQMSPVPHFGLVKIDSIGNNMTCSHNSFLIPLSNNLNINNTQFSYQSSGTYDSISVIVSSINMFAFNGCVDFISNISENEYNSNISIFPNPSSDFIHFKFKERAKKEAEIKIYNLMGETIYKNKLDNSLTNKINVSNLINGLYILEISNDENVQRGKFIKQ